MGTWTADAAEPLTWTVVMPVKALSGAKSRMGSTDQSSPAPLAFAFFKDTVQAALACTAVSTVVVATGDDTIGNWASVRGCRVVGDDDHPGINAAAQWGARSAPAGSGIAVLVSDLPCLTADSLADVLMLAGLARAFVPGRRRRNGHDDVVAASPGNPVAVPASAPSSTVPTGALGASRSRGGALRPHGTGPRGGET